MIKSSYVPPLREVRMARGVGLRELSRRVGVNASYLLRLERGQTSASVATLFMIAVELGMEDTARALRPWVRTSRT